MEINGFRRNISIGILSVCIICVGCKTPALVEQTDVKSIPQSYAASTDSSNSADIEWRDFFADKDLIILIDTALKNNLDVLMTLQKIEMAKNDLQLSKGAMLPKVGGHAGSSLQKFGLYTSDGAGNASTEITPGNLFPIHLGDFYIGLHTSWEADIWGKLRNTREAALSRYLSSREGANLVITNLVAEVASTYYELLSLDNELDIVRETIKVQQDALEIVKIQKQASRANELGVQQFEAQVLNSQSLEFELLQIITENENKMNFLLGRFPQPIVRNKSNFTNQAPTQISAGVPSFLLQNRPDIRQAQFELLATKSDVKAAKAAFYPSVNITGALGFQAFNTAYLFTSPQSLAYNILGTLVAPLVNRSAIRAQFNNAKANQITAMYNYQKAILNGYVEVSNELSNIKNLEQIQELKTKEVAALTSSIDISNDLFKSSRATYFEVLMTQRTALQSRLELVSVQQRQYSAMVNIYKALGGGWK